MNVKIKDALFVFCILIIDWIDKKLLAFLAEFVTFLLVVFFFLPPCLIV